MRHAYFSASLDNSMSALLNITTMIAFATHALLGCCLHHSHHRCVGTLSSVDTENSSPTATKTRPDGHFRQTVGQKHACGHRHQTCGSSRANPASGQDVPDNPQCPHECDGFDCGLVAANSIRHAVDLVLCGHTVCSRLCVLTPEITTQCAVSVTHDLVILDAQSGTAVSRCAQNSVWRV